MITKKQKQVFDFVKKYYVKNDYAPSLEEIKKKFKLASISAITHLKCRIRTAKS